MVDGQCDVEIRDIDSRVTLRMGLGTDPSGPGSLMLQLVAPGVCIEGVVPLLSEDEGLATFFGSLAAQWRGWEGDRSWTTIEGQLVLTARHRGSRVALDLRLQPDLWQGWVFTTTLQLGAGEDLTRAADAVAEMARRASPL